MNRNKLPRFSYVMIPCIKIGKRRTGKETRTIVKEVHRVSKWTQVDGKTPNQKKTK